MTVSTRAAISAIGQDRDRMVGGLLGDDQRGAGEPLAGGGRHVGGGSLGRR